MSQIIDKSYKQEIEGSPFAKRAQQTEILMDLGVIPMEIPDQEEASCESDNIEMNSRNIKT